MQADNLPSSFATLMLDSDRALATIAAFQGTGAAKNNINGREGTGGAAQWQARVTSSYWSEAWSKARHG